MGDRAVGAWADPRVAVTVATAAAVRPQPAAAALLPMRLTASSVDALRSCPYRFFALHMLGLREAGELGGEIAKNDYGSWLHAVLHAFHREREAPAPPADELARLHAVGLAEQRRLHLRDEDFLPYAAAFERLAPRYVAWLHERDAGGARWRDGERDVTVRPAALGGVELHGRLDRFDDAGGALQLIDYKTSPADKLRKRVKAPFEDTQLAFYAALMSDAPERGGRPLAAVYLALDASDGVTAVEHVAVADSARRLVEALADDYARLRDGSALQALGEGAGCDWCEARGLCRRDHWPAA